MKQAFHSHRPTAWQATRDRANAAPGKRSLTSRLVPRSEPPVQRKPAPRSIAAADAADAGAGNLAALTAVAFRPDLHGGDAPLQASASSPGGLRAGNPVLAAGDRVAAAAEAHGPSPSGRNTTGSGNALDAALRGKMEGAFGADFSAVRVHQSPRADDIGARAYTQGTDIHFAPGQYQPGTVQGQELIGHELTHVVQQAQGRVRATTQAKGANINDDAALEREADEMGARAARGETIERVAGPLRPAATAAGTAIQRLPWSRRKLLEGLPQKEVGEDRLLAAIADQLDSYAREMDKQLGDIGKKESVDLVNNSVNPEGLRNTLRILVMLCDDWWHAHDSASELRSRIEDLRDAAERELEDLTEANEVPKYQLTALEGQDTHAIKWKLHPYAGPLFEQGPPGQGYFGAADVTTGIVYLLPGYNQVVVDKKQDRKDPQNWRKPDGMKEEWKVPVLRDKKNKGNGKGGTARRWAGRLVPRRQQFEKRPFYALVEPLGQNSGGGHRELIAQYGLIPKEQNGQLLGFGIFKGKNGVFREFRNRSATLNTGAVQYPESTVSTWRKRAIPADLARDLEGQLRGLLARYHRRADPTGTNLNLTPEEDMRERDVYQRLDHHKQETRDANRAPAPAPAMAGAGDMTPVATLDPDRARESLRQEVALRREWFGSDKAVTALRKYSGGERDALGSMLEKVAAILDEELEDEGEALYATVFNNAYLTCFAEYPFLQKFLQLVGDLLDALAENS